MAEKYFVDTNILIYAHDRAAGQKHMRARQLIERLWTSGEGVLSTQVIQELCINLRRKLAHPLPVVEIHALVQDYLSWEIVINSPDSSLRALEIEQRYRVSFWDALILHSAESAGAEVLYSEDFASGRRYGPVRVVNPLTT